MTFPRIDRNKSVLESFSNCRHCDLTDCTDKNQGIIISNYLLSDQCKILDNY